MKFVTATGHTYDSGNFKVKVGDTVILPSPSHLRHVKGDTWESTVASLGSDYTGYLVTILGVKIHGISIFEPQKPFIKKTMKAVLNPRKIKKKAQQPTLELRDIDIRTVNVKGMSVAELRNIILDANAYTQLKRGEAVVELEELMYQRGMNDWR